MTQIVAAKSNPQAAHTYWTMGRADPALAFRAARRHSRLVRILRIAIPVAVVLGLTVVVLLTYFNPARMFAKLPVDIGHLVVSGTKITMEKPRLTGFTHDARVYDLTDAQVAYAATDVLHLHALKEKLDAMLAREGRSDLAAACFRFLPDRSRLDLSGWAAEDIFSHSV